MHKVFLTMILAGFCALLPFTSGGSTGSGISVTASDFQFEPHHWTVSSGQTVTLDFTNQGTQEHEWVILKLGEEVTLPFSDDDEGKIYWEIEADPGTISQGSFMAPKNPGTYTVVCGKKEHLEKGMLGLVIVQ